VWEGLVHVTRLSDGASVDVAAGFHATVGEGIELAALPIGGEAARTADAADAGAEGVSKTRYADGRVILRDDFTDGLGNWRFLRTPAGSRSLPGAEAWTPSFDHVRIVEVERKGDHINAMSLAAAETGGQVVWARLAAQPDVSAYSVELSAYFRPLKRARRKSLTFDVLGYPGVGREVLRRGAGHTMPCPVSRWFSMKLEVVEERAPSGEVSTLVTTRRDGKLAHTRRFRGPVAFVYARVCGADMAIADVTVREMRPAPTEGEGEAP
jgi:hypothetical protein